MRRYQDSASLKYLLFNITRVSNQVSRKHAPNSYPDLALIGPFYPQWSSSTVSLKFSHPLTATDLYTRALVHFAPPHGSKT